LAAISAAAGAGAVVARRRRRAQQAKVSTGRLPVDLMGRRLQVAGLGTRIVADTAFTKARQVFADAPRRLELQHDLELRSAEQVAERLGNLKGALMKLGQMASYLDEGLPPHVREVLAQLQSNAPPMSAELAAQQIEAAFGQPPTTLFAEWDPQPLASASIGQVHRAITHEGQAVAVKVQYPGVAEAIRSDLATADWVFGAIGLGFSALDTKSVTDELKARLIEELDYAQEAAHQRRFADFYAGHPTIHVPAVIDQYSCATVLTTELATGATFDEAVAWNAEQRNAVAETIFRFVFRSLYDLRSFNGDPHPGNYLFGADGHVTFLDFGLCRTFNEQETAGFLSLINHMVINHDATAFRQALNDVGLLAKNAPASDEELADFFKPFYALIMHEGEFEFTAEYASAIVRRTFATDSPVAKYATVPPSFVIIQRINLGLYALLGSLRATADWRKISEEIWPMVRGGAATPLGVREHAWIAQRAADGARETANTANTAPTDIGRTITSPTKMAGS
jgi:predicted unusual protein kinase regulating ubiquinone biosynthesis (AarF/ABC1/UbiB family)